MKEKKRLLPEVLPAPARVSAGGGARATVLAHYERLVALAGGAAVAAACNAGYGVVDPLPPPHKCAPADKPLRLTAIFVRVPDDLVLDGGAFDASVLDDAGDGGRGVGAGGRILLQLTVSPPATTAGR